MGYARIKVTPELIVQALHMPPGTRIVDAGMVDDGRVMLLYVQHEDIRPAQSEGMYNLLELDPVVTHHPERFEWDWNQPEPKG